MSGVVLMCGLPASGKTTTAGRLHAHAGGVLIRSCDVYQSLGISLPHWARRTEGFSQHVLEYERERDRAYEEIARRLEAALASTRELIVVDAVHGERAKRQVVYRLCETYGRTPVLIWCRCDDGEEIRRRFQRRQGREWEPESEASDHSVFRHIAGLWEDPRDDPQPVSIVVHDTLRGELRSARGTAWWALDLLKASLFAVPGARPSNAVPSRAPTLRLAYGWSASSAGFAGATFGGRLGGGWSPPSNISRMDGPLRARAWPAQLLGGGSEGGR